MDQLKKQEAECKASAAAKASEQALKARKAAYNALKQGVMVNGFGIVSDPAALRNNLWEANDQIKSALAWLDNVDWPTDDEYDHS